MSESRDVLEPLVGEGSAVVARGWGDPAEDPAEPVIVVVLRKARQGLFGGGQAGEALAVEHLSLEDVPEGLNLAVGPGRRDLCSQVADMELLKALAETREQAREPTNKGLAVVAHELQGPATEFETLIHPEHDGYRLRLGQDAQADDKPRVVVDQARDPGFDVSPAKVDEERAFQVVVPKLVGPPPLIARTRRARHRTAAATARFEELVNVVGADSVNLAPAHFCGDPLRIPVGVKPDRDDDRVHPGRDCDSQPMWSPGTVHQASDSARLKGGEPAVERAARDFELPACSLDANVQGKPHSSHPKANSVKAGFPRLTGRPTVMRSQEQEAGALLIPVPTNATVRIGWVDLSRVRHAGTVGPAVPFLSRKFTERISWRSK